MPAPASSWFRARPEGLLVHLRVTPNAGRDAVDGVEIRDDGNAVLRVRVAAMPDRGRANAAVIALLAKAMGIPRSAISLESGQTSRFKALAIAGPSAELAARLAALAG